MNPLQGVILVLALALFAGHSSAQNAEPVTGKQLQVAVSECPPFVMQEGGQPSGVAISLWADIAAEIGADYTLTEVPIVELLEALSTETTERKFDVGISCLTVTAERERFVDFSHSFYETFIGVAVKERGLLESLVGVLTNPATLRVLAIFIGIATLIGVIFLMLERGSHDKLFTMEGRAGKLVEAFLVGAVFITRGPINFWEFKSLASRTVATLLAIAATFIIAGITAILASLFTVDTLRSQIRSLSDLGRVSVGAVAMSTSSQFLRDNGIPHMTLDGFEDLLVALDRGKLDAVVADEAFLRFSIREGKEQGKYRDLQVLPLEFAEQNYGFALPTGSPLIEDFNLALLDIRTRPQWQQTINRYLGE